MPSEGIIKIAESLNFKWERGAWRNKLSNGVENEIQLGIFEKFYNAGRKDVLDKLEKFEKNRRKLILTKAERIEYTPKQYYIYMRGATDGHCIFRQNLIQFIKNNSK